MPTVPTLDGPRIQNNPYSGSFSTRAGADDMGAIQAAQVGRAGKALNAVGDAITTLEQEQDKLWKLEREAELDQLELNLLQDPQNGVFAKRGKDAIGISSKVEETLDQSYKAVLENAPKRIKDEVMAHINARKRSTLARVADYERREMNAYGDQLLATRADRAVADAAAFYNDPGKLALSRQKIMSSFNELAKRKGYDGEVTQAMISEGISKMHVGVIDRMIANKEDISARKYLEANRGEIDGSVIGKIEGRVKEASTVRQSQGIADEMLGKHDNEADALSAVRSKYDGELEAKAVAEIKTRFAEKKRHEAEAEKDNIKKAVAHIEEGGRYEDLDEDVKTAISQVRGLPEHLQKRQEQVASGAPTVSDTGTYADLMRTFRDEPAEFSKIDLFSRDVVTKLSTADRKMFERFQLGIDKNAVKEASAARRLREGLNNPTVRQMYEATGGGPFKPSGKDKPERHARSAAFFAAFQNALAGVPDDVKLTPKDYTDIAAGLLLRGEVKGMFHDPNVRAFELGLDDNAEKRPTFYTAGFAKENSAFINDIATRSKVPPSEAANIIEMMARRGMPVTADTVGRTYRSALEAAKARKASEGK